MRISTSAARAYKKLLVFVADICFVKNQQDTYEPETTSVYTTASSARGYNSTPATPKAFNYNNSDDARQNDASFSFIPGTSPLKNSVMKSFLQMLQIVVNIITRLAEWLYKRIFKEIFFNNNKYMELQPVPIDNNNPCLLPINQTVMRCFLSTATIFKSLSFPKAILQSTFILLFSFASLWASANTVTSVAVSATQTGTLIYGTASSVTYTVTITPGGAAGTTTTTLSLTGTALPAGATASFSTNPVSLPTGSSTPINVTLTITTTATVAGTTSGITVSATNTPTRVSGTFTFVVSPRPVSLTGTRAYDGTTNASSANLSISNIINSDVVTLSGTGTLASKNVGTQALSTTITAPTRVQFASDGTGGNLGGSSSATSFQPVFASAPTNGNTLVAVISTRGTTANQVTGISQTGVNNWTFVAQATNANGITTEIWYASNVSGAGTQVTINQTNAIRAAGVVIEYSGILTPNPVDVTSSSTGNSVTASTGTTATTAQANEVWIGGIGLISSSNTLTGITNSFTAVTDDASNSGTPGNNARIYALERIVSATGTANSGGTVTPSSQWSGAIATFRVSSTITGITLGGANASKYTVVGGSGSLVITALALNISGTKVYDGTTGFSNAQLTVNNLISGDAITLTGAAVSSKNVATYTSFSTNPTLSNSNYTMTGATVSVSITARPLNISGTKVYDGTTGFSNAQLTVNNLISGDAITLTGAAVSSKNVATYTSFSTNPTLSNSNYTMTGATVSVSITARPLNISGTKVYDGTTGFSNAQLTVNNLISGDAIILTGAAVSSKNVATYTSFSTNPTLSNSNYTMTGATVSVSITALALNISGTKVYDGTTGFSNAQLTVNNLISGDAITLTGAAVSSKNVATYTSFSTNPTLSNSNYTMTGATVSVSITALALNISGTKVYDGTTGFSNAQLTVNNLISGDAITLTGAAVSSKNVATYTSFSTNPTLSNSNYTMTGATVSVSITARPLNISGTKVYDGTTGFSNAQLTVNNLISGDAITLTGAAVSSKNVATYTSFSTNPTLSNSNYTMTGATVSVSITQATPTLSVSGTNLFTYTGSSQGPATVSYNGDGTTSLLYTSTSGPLYSSATPPTNAGNYQVVANATTGTNYGAASSNPFDFTISQATTVTTVTINGGPFTYTGSAITPATVTVTGPGGLSLTPTADYANNTNAGTATASYNYAGDANYAPSSDSKDFTIGQATTVTTVTINGGPFTYTGSAITPATVTVTGPGGLSLTPTADYANNTNAGTATASYNYAGDANYAPSSDSKDFTIGQATTVTTVTINGGPFTYTGSAITPATVTVTGPGGLSLTPTADYANNTNAGTATASYNYAGDANYAPSSDSKDFTIGQATTVTTVTINGGPFTYTGSAITPATVTVTGPGGLSLTPTADYANNTNAGTATASYNYAGDANYAPSSDSKDFTIGQATTVTTVTINGGPFTYTGSAITPATVTVTGPGGLSLTPTADYANNTNAGTATASYNYAGDANYAPSSDSKDFTIGQATTVTTVTINGGPFTYTGSAITPATVTVTGPGGLSLTPTADYANNTNAGTATASYNYAGDANYAPSSDSKDFTIGQATTVTTVTINGGPFTYTGSAITPATVTVTGPGGLSLTPTADYANNTNAGTATASYNYAGDANYAPSSDSKDFTIGQATTVTTVTINGGPFTYTGSAITPATVTVTGPGGLSLTPTADYANNTNAGTATASYNYAGDANYAPSSDSKDFTIGQATTVTTVTINGGPFTYTGSAITPATVTVTGPGGLSLTPTADYANNTNAGTATASYNYAGDANYAPSSDSKDFTIGQATTVTTVTINGGPFTYTGSAITPATVTVTGPGGLSLTPTADYANNTNAGTATASYNYAGDANYAPSSDSKDFTIGQATTVTTVTINGGPFTYTGSAITPATVTVTGPGGLSLTPTADYANNTNAGTATASYNYAGDANYAPSSDSKDFTIGQATTVTTVTINGGPFTYTGSAITPATVTVTGPGGLSLTPTADYANNTNAGTATASYNYAGDANYAPSSDSKDFTIGQATLYITANNQSKCAGQPFNFTGTEFTTSPLISGDAVTFVTLTSGGSSASALPGSYSIVPGGATGTGLSNYSISYINGSFTVIAHPTAAISGTTAICSGGSTDLTLMVSGSGTISGTLSDGTAFSGTAPTITVTVSPTTTTTYTVATLNDANCTATVADLTLSAVVTVNNDATIIRSSPAGTDAQTVCINTAISNIVYTIGGGGTGATAAGLPAGVTGSYDTNTGLFTITGMPSVNGVFTYSVTTTGPCFTPNLTGTITVNANSTINLTSANTTTAQTVCINTPIAPISYSYDGGATTATVTGLPTGVTFDNTTTPGVISISGTPALSVTPGTYTYTVTAHGPCIDAVATGTITVTGNSTISLTSAGTDVQTICFNSAIFNITYAVGGSGTGAVISAGALPAGVTGDYDGNTGMFTISGTPTVTGTYTFTVTTTGPCGNVSASQGSITIQPTPLAMIAGTAIVCQNDAAPTITFSNAMALPVTVTYTLGNGTSTTTNTINVGANSTATVSAPTNTPGTYTYTITSVQYQGTPNCANTITGQVAVVTVNANSTISLSSGPVTQTVCYNTSIATVKYAIGGGATNASITAGALPTGVTGSYSGGVFTISGTPTQPGTFNYTVTTTGPCNNVSLSGTITVNPSPVVNAISNASYCNGAAGAAISFSSPTTGGTISYSWSSSADVGFGTSGNTNIGAYTATNITNAVITATVTVTPHITNNAVTCDGTPVSFTVTVNPAPVVNAVSNLVYCANTPGAAINFSSPITGGTVTYSWTSTTNVGFGLNGTGSIGAFTAANGSINPVTATVTVTPSLNGCTGSPISFTVTVNPNANAGTISGSSTLCPGLTAQLSTNGSAGGGWTSSAPTVASVNAVTGFVTALSSGTTTIFYTVSSVCGASTASFNITVTPGASAGTIIGSTTVCVGSTSQLASTGNTGGTWLGGAPYASVSATGLVTGLTPGTATIFYLVSNSCGFDLTSTTITISAGTSAGTIFGTAAICPGTATQLFTTGTAGGTWASSNSAVALSAGGGFIIGVSAGTATISYTVPASSCGAASVAFFTLTVNPSGNAGIITAPPTYTGSLCTGNSVLLSTNGAGGGTWFSASPGVATVNSSGLVTGVAQGSAVIFYFVSNTCGTSSATFPVIVNAAPNAGAISGPNAVCTGSSINLSNNGDPGGTWSSNNSSIAVALPGGTVFGIGAGTATITYTTPSGACGSASTSYTVTVNPAPNAGTVSGASSVCAGLSTPFTSTGGTGTGSWSSSNTAVASVNASTGLVTGVAAGNATITYTATTSCGSAIQSAPITVNPVLNAGTISGGTSVCKGSTINLTTNGNSGGTWSSSNPGIAFVNASTGVVTGTGAGSATITYSLVNNGCGTATATQVVTVTDLPTAGTINSASVCTGLSTNFSSTGGTTGGSWSSSNTAVATVNATSGVVTGVAAGSATITYTVTTGCGTATASGTVTVNAVLAAGTISGGNAVCNGSTLSLTASGNSGGTWASTNTSVATVDQYGLVTSVAPGNTNITYTVSNTCGTSMATQPFTVNTVANAGTITGNANVCAGLSTPFTTNGTVGGTWSSSNTTVATVNAATGIVNGVAAGSATITYTVTTPCGTASQSAPVTVNSLADAGTISGPNAVCVNASINLSSNITGGTWSTSASSIATVNGAGQVAGVAAGTVTIKYTVTTTCGTNVASYTVTVNSAPDAGFFDNTTSTVCVGASLAINDVGGMPGGTWRSSNPARATVDASGNVTGVSAGNTIITYSVTNSCGTSTSGINITVNSLPNAGTISGASAVCAFATINLSASGDAGGTWTSTTPGIATVDPNTGVVTGVAAGTTTIIYTVGSTDVCGTASATHLVTVNPVPYAGTITGGPTVCAGLAISLTSTGSVGGTWISSNPAAATVNASTGLVTGVAAGTTTITYTVSTATCGSATAVTTITVSPLLDAGTINGPSSVCTGANINLTSTGSAGGTWTSSNGGVAYVDPFSGQVTAGALPGTTTITYTVSNSCITSSATKVISVNAIPTGGTVSGAATLCIGASTPFTSNGTPGGTWSSSNTSVATVNSVTGVVTGVAAGNATIVYTVSSSGCGIATAQATIAVNPGLNAGTISGATSVCVNATIILSSTNPGGTWSSNNTGIASVDASTGIVTGVAGGSVSIVYTVTTSCGTSAANYAITVNPLPNAGTIGGTPSVCIGSTTALTSNGNSGGTWSSSNASAATVNASTGVVTGVAAGSTIIIYTVTSGSGCGQASVSATVTVNAPPAAGTVSGASALCAGNTTTFTSNGTGGGSWSSNNIAAATVNATTGEVTGVAAGSATITYTVTGTCGSASSSANITISAIPLAGNISGTTTLCTGATSALTSNGTGGGSWSSNNSLVATVNAATGVVTAVGPGSATITYMVTNSCGTTNATATVTVNALPNAGTVSGAATLCVSAQTSFTTTGDGGGTWSSSNTAIATVDASTGLVTGIAAGSATITYTATSTNCGSQTASAGITIKPLPIPGVINGSATVCVNGTTPFTSTGDAGGTWTSNNPAVATVNASTGVVTGVAAGSTTIMYSVTNSCTTLSATKVIIVNPLANAGIISGPATVCMGGTSTAFTSSGDAGGTWSSSNAAIATVDVNGVVTGVATGNANIIYTVTSPNGCGTATASAPIAVITLPNAGTISGSSTVCIGATTTYSDAVSGGVWSSQSPSIATVDAGTGVVTGVAQGNATITYTVTNSCGNTPVNKTITVNAVPNAGTVSGAATVCVNGTATFTTTGAPAGGSWSSSNTAIALVNSGTGLVTGVAAGTTNIIYTSATPCGTTTASAPITVLGTPSAGTINGLTAVCMGTSPTYTNAVSGGTWSSTSTGMATINAATGVLTTLAPGNTTIQYTVSNGCNTSVASLLITVNPLANAGTVSGASTICAGAQATFTTNSPVVTNGTTITGAWSSSNTAIATVNASTGVVTGVAAGTANIIYTSTTPCGTATASASITVNPVLTAGTVSGAAQLCIGSTTTYTSSGSAGGSWSSLTPSVATVNASTGVITGVAAGNATITYTIASGCGAPASSSKVIAVSAGTAGTLSGSSTVCSGDYVTFTRSGGTSGGTWSSSNTSVATVSNSGRVTGVSAGTAVISYTVTSGCGVASTTKSITVSTAPGISVTDITTSTDLNECSALVTLGSNVTVTGSGVILQYRIGYYFFSFPIPSTYTFPRGTTPVVVVASNSCGFAVRAFNVTVNDNQPPTITCKPNATRTVNGNSSRYSVHGHEFDATASDGCGIASLVYSLSGATNDAFERENTSLNNVRFNVGTTIITWRATDVNGNVSMCTTTVTVVGSNGGNANPPDQSQSNAKVELFAAGLTVNVAPNPTSNYFTLTLKSIGTEKVKISVVDAVGRPIEKIVDILPNSTLQIGGKYHPGIYLVQAIQGQQTVVLKLIKEGN